MSTNSACKYHQGKTFTRTQCLHSHNVKNVHKQDQITYSCTFYELKFQYSILILNVNSHKITSNESAGFPSQKHAFILQGNSWKDCLQLGSQVVQELEDGPQSRKGHKLCLQVLSKPSFSDGVYNI